MRLRMTYGGLSQSPVSWTVHVPSRLLVDHWTAESPGTFLSEKFVFARSPCAGIEVEGSATRGTIIMMNLHFVFALSLLVAASQNSSRAMILC